MFSKLPRILTLLGALTLSAHAVSLTGCGRKAGGAAGAASTAMESGPSARATIAPTPVAVTKSEKEIAMT
ncbi:MAG TPA: hypothetical protein VF103_02610, partial [Polyangiaceae bacterium]